MSQPHWTDKYAPMIPRPMAAQSPADRQAEANFEVEQIAKAFYNQVRNNCGLDEAGNWEWEDVAERWREQWRDWARGLIQDGVIKPGPRLSKPERPMEHQTVLDDFVGPME